MKEQNQKSDEILNKRRQLGPFPMEKLKRVEQPTTQITESVQRIDKREGVGERAERGDFGPVVARELERDVEKYPISAIARNMVYYLGPRAEGEVAPSKAPIPEDPEILSRHIKSLGYFLRADIVGIGRVPAYAVYSHDEKGNPIELEHKFAIVVVVDQDYDTLVSSNGYDWISGSQSYRSYSATAFIASLLADYIRKLGYPARAHFCQNYQVAITPLLLWAGIGEMSRVGVVLNPFLGIRFKAAAVTTDLPLVPDGPIDFGLQEFCSVCKKCAIECPSRAIPMGDKVMYNGYKSWRADIPQCAKFRFANPNGSSCGRCIKMCPWNKPSGWTHDAVRWSVKNLPALDRLIVKMDSIWGYGKQDTAYKWWFDLEEVDGVLQVPKRDAGRLYKETDVGLRE